MPKITETHKYDDIIHLPYPFPGKKRKHPPMDILDRSKIFAPFAALKGHEDAIESKQIEYLEGET